MRRAVGEGVEPSRSGYSHVTESFPYSSPPRLGGVSAINFTILQYIISPRARVLLGKGSNLQGVVSQQAGFPYSPPPGQGGVSAKNFTTQHCFFI